MDKKYEALFTPWKIGNVEIKNRIVMCPMGGTSLFGWMGPQKFNKEAADMFLTIAKNGCGLVIPGIAPLRNMLGNKWLYKVNKAFKDLKVWMEEFHKTGAKLFVQLTAGFGRSFSIPNGMTAIVKNKFLSKLIKPIFDFDRLLAAPSALPARWYPEHTVREITVEEIKGLVRGYALTAKKLKEAGVDGVEVHAVHEGYLIDQFTTPYTNKRTDEYGGSFENRYRFATDIVKAIKAECGEDFPVSVRYSAVSKTKDFCVGALPGEDYTEVGRDIKESEKAVKYLQDAGYDMLNTDNGTYDAWYWAHPPVYMPENCNLEDAAHVRKFCDIPVVCAGKMEPDVAAKAIKEGRIDGMGVARQFLVDNEWIKKLQEDRLEDIMPCIHCHNGCFPLAHYKGVACDTPLHDSIHMARCALNPQTMDYGKYELKPAKTSKRVAIIGGGIAGMEAARVCIKRGHLPTIYEKTDKLGGVFIAAAAPDFKNKDKELIAWYRRQMEKLEVEIKYNTEVTDLSKLDADEIIVATGSTKRTLRMPGAERAIDAVEYLLGEKEVGKNVVIIGGGLTGCEIAYDLHLKGKNPIIIEMRNDLMAVPGICLANSSYLRDYFNWKKVPVYLESSVAEIKDKTVVVKTKDGEEEVKADSIILAIGYNPNPVAPKAKNVHIVGDANGIGNLRTVIWGVWDKCMKI
ncbi:MAG: FAD-dependent oxidoreductase [Clostridia bacterium]|nr:FAD-dependent oxidoreductase [Clostridia bacterium]